MNNPHDQWETPKYILNWIQKTRGLKIVYDLAASDTNAVCENYFTKEDDAIDKLINPYDRASLWNMKQGQGMLWCNPPYSSGNIINFTRSCIIYTVDCFNALPIALLIPADTSTSYFEQVMNFNAAHVTFFTGRIKFHHPTLNMGSPRFGSMLVYFDATQDFSDNKVSVVKTKDIKDEYS